MSIAIQLAERGLLSDRLIRTGIRKLLDERLHALAADPRDAREWVERLENRPLAEDTEAANQQHYEVPAAYFQNVLGPRLKYSSAFWPEGCASLEHAEAAMLDLSCERAELTDGQDVLELGCGWGSLSLWMAEHYPRSRITAISNSRSQREFIQARAREQGLHNLTVLTCDINDFAPDGSFDRVVSVEMFEHLRNHRRLLGRIHDWLKPGGKLFVHIFAHHTHAYLYEVKSSKDWMSKYFFTGGIMPSADLLPAAAESLREEARWEVDGRHYSRTLEAWLQRQDARRQEVMAVFKDCYGRDARLWFQRWRIFYMACSELFAFNQGKEWKVVHHRFIKPE
ncbi:MAG: SAM-dependent methyltransferase [Opitutales bacterium]